MTFSLSKQALKYLKALQPRLTKRIISAIEDLPDFGDVKILKGKKTPLLYRLRIGKYQVVFHINEDEIQIIKIDTRGDIYKK